MRNAYITLAVSKKKVPFRRGMEYWENQAFWGRNQGPPPQGGHLRAPGELGGTEPMLTSKPIEETPPNTLDILTELEGVNITK